MHSEPRLAAFSTGLRLSDSSTGGQVVSRNSKPTKSMFPAQGTTRPSYHPGSTSSESLQALEILAARPNFDTDDQRDNDEWVKTTDDGDEQSHLDASDAQDQIPSHQFDDDQSRSCKGENLNPATVDASSTSGDSADSTIKKLRAEVRLLELQNKKLQGDLKESKANNHNSWRQGRAHESIVSTLQAQNQKFRRCFQAFLQQAKDLKSGGGLTRTAKRSFNDLYELVEKGLQDQ